MFLSSRKKTINTTHESTLIWKYNDSESTLATHFIKYNDYESTLATHVFKNNDYESTFASHFQNNNNYESTLATHVQKYPRVHPRLTSPQLRVVVVRRVKSLTDHPKFVFTGHRSTGHGLHTGVYFVVQIYCSDFFI